MEFRDLFKSIFGRESSTRDDVGRNATTYKILSDYNSYFSPLPKSLYNDSTVRTCVDVIARNFAKVQLKHVVQKGKEHERTNDALDYVLSSRPNPFMTAYDFLYKVAAMLFMNNNVFIKVQLGARGEVIGLFPLSYQEVELKGVNGECYVKFSFAGETTTETIPYSDLIHLRRHFNTHDILGAENQSVLRPPLSVLNASKQSVENAVHNSNKIKGILQMANVTRPEDRDSKKVEFLTAIKNDGVGVTDASFEYKPIVTSATMAGVEHISFCTNDIYKIFGVNEAIVSGNFTAEEWASFYETTLEPLIIQITQEFSSKLFTDSEKAAGHRVMCNDGRLQFAKIEDKVNLVKILQAAGMLTVNEGREMFGLPPVEDGDKRLVSLNNVNADKQDDYQLGKKGADKNEESKD